MSGDAANYAAEIEQNSKPPADKFFTARQRTSARDESNELPSQFSSISEAEPTRSARSWASRACLARIFSRTCSSTVT